MFVQGRRKTGKAPNFSPTVLVSSYCVYDFIFSNNYYFIVFYYNWVETDPSNTRVIIFTENFIIQLNFCFVLFKYRFLKKSKSLGAINTFKRHFYTFVTKKWVSANSNTRGRLIHFNVIVANHNNSCLKSFL